ncbi:MAG TPA: PA14 domain-containing protein, partial [Phycisphaerae bacterium]|nr:PA14 domain-containing protein [Phycisphaerae bacterium]
MMRVVPVLTTCLAVLPALATASQDTRSHEPGVIVRLYDIGVGVHYIPELAPGQLPNVVKVMDTIELRTDRDDFAPLADHFLTEVIGDLKIDRPGPYAFRLISDDGSRLWIDDRLVIDHDGLHGADPKDGTAELTAGVHTLRILHFESAAGEHLELRWRQPGAADDKFTLIPTAALSYDTGVSRETSPGTKKIIPPLRRGRPGDGTPVAGPHPGFVPDPDGFLLPAGLEVVARRLYGPVTTRDMTRPLLAWLTGVEDGARMAVARLPGETYAGQMLVMDRAERKRLWIDRPGELSQGCILRFEKSEVFPNTPTGKAPFEMLAVRVMTNGFEIEFTKPLDSRCGWEPDSYYIEQWPFSVGSDEATERRSDEGGTEPEAQARVSPPRRDGVRYPVKSASVSPDRKKVFLEIENLKPSHVVYIRLLPPCVSEDGELPW